MKFKITILVVFLLSVNFVYSESNYLEVTPRFIRIQQDQGLIQNSINSIIQDDFGFMWLGTPNGLYRHDGYTFEAFKQNVHDSNTLVSNTITNLFEDSDGLIWIGTTQGLSIYNPHTESYIANSSLSSGIQVNSIVEAYRHIFLGTSNGLYILSKQNNSYKVKNIVTVNPEVAKYSGLPNKLVRTLCFDTDSSLWIGTDKGVAMITSSQLKGYLLKGDKFVFNHFDKEGANYASIVSNNIQVIRSNSNGGVYIGTDRNGLYSVSSANIEKINFYKSKEQTDVRIMELNVLNDSILYIGTFKNGLIKHNLNADKSNIYKFDPLNDYSISSNKIKTIYKDNSNVLWIGCTRGGVSKLYTEQKNFSHIYHIPNNKNSLSHNLTSAVFEDKEEKLWIATYGGGVDLIHKKGKKTEILHLNNYVNRFNEIQVFSIFGDDNGNIWFGCRVSGLHLLTKKEKEKLLKKQSASLKNYKTFNENGEEKRIINVSTIYQSSSNVLWLVSASNGGIIRMAINNGDIENPVFNGFKHDPFNKSFLLSNSILAIFKDSKNNLWLGNRGVGISKVKLDENDYPVKVVAEEENYEITNKHRIFVFVEDKDDNIWVGTFGGGIKILKNGELNKNELIELTESKGLADNSVYGMLRDYNGDMWISTDVGISKIKYDSKEVRNFNESDGIPKGNFRKNAYTKGPTGNLFFGGISGIAAFQAGNITPDTSSPKTIITKLFIQDNLIKPNKEYNNRVVIDKPIFEFDDVIKIHPKERSFSIEFAATHYAFPNYNRFSYILEGESDVWTDLGEQNKVTYSNLNPGKYIFKVKSFSPDGIESSNIAQLKFKIRPPFYLSSLAYLIYVIIIIASLWLYRRVIIVRQEYANELRFEQLEKEKIEEINKNKLIFFTNISHEFKTPLTLILGPLESILSIKKLDRHIVENLKIMRSNTNRLLRLVNQLLEFRKVESGHLNYTPERSDIVYFLKALIASFEGLAKNKQIDLVLDCEEKFLPLNFDLDKIEKVFSNLLTNAIKYTPEGGRVTMKIRKDHDHKPIIGSNDVIIVDGEISNCAIISVEDSGRGMDQEQVEKIFNRFYQAGTSDNDIQIGTGIGLSLVKSFVEVHKGAMVVTSKKDMGSNFIVKLPLDFSGNEMENNEELSKVPKLLIGEDELNATLTKSAELPKFFTDFSTDNRPLLLIVDDNIEIRQFLTNSLEKHFDLLEAGDGEEAYEVACDKVPDLIISDVMMPKMDGMELTIKLKEHTATDHIPIILLTAKGALEHRIEGIKKGADSYIPKPFQLEHLYARIEQLLLVRKKLKDKYQKESGLLPEKKSKSFNPGEMAFLQKVEVVIEENLANTEFAVNDLESALCLSRMQLYRKLTSLVGLAANEFIRDYRLRKAAIFLSEGEVSVSEVIHKTGFSNHSYFTRSFKKKYGKSPKEFSKDYKS